MRHEDQTQIIHPTCSRALPFAIGLVATLAGCSGQDVPDGGELAIRPAMTPVGTSVTVTVSGKFVAEALEANHNEGMVQAIGNALEAHLVHATLADDIQLGEVQLLDPSLEPACSDERAELKDLSCFRAAVPSNLPLGMYTLQVVDALNRTIVLEDAFRVLGPLEQLDRLQIDPISDQTAGTPFTVQIRGLDVAGQVIDELNGSLVLDYGGSTLTSTTIPLQRGQASTSLMLTRAMTDNVVTATLVEARFSESSNPFDIVAGPPARVVLVDVPARVGSEVCLSTSGVHFYDRWDNVTTLAETTNFAFATDPDAGLFVHAGPDCDQLITEATGLAGDERVPFYLEGGDVGEVTLRVSSDVGTVTATISVIPSCGDNFVESNEACDDGNVDAGDGCSPACQFEPGYLCGGEPSECYLEGEVALVDTDAMECAAADGSLAAPFCLIEDALATGRRYVIVRGQAPHPTPVVIDDATVDIIGGPGVTIEGDDNKGFDIDGASVVRIRDFTVIGTMGGDAIEITGTSQVTIQEVVIGPTDSHGIHAKTGTFVSIERSWIRENTRGGIQLDSELGFTLVNSYVTDNPGFGVKVTEASADSIIDYATVTGSAGGMGMNRGYGVDCEVPVQLSNSIIWGNEEDGTGVTNDCQVTYSNLQDVDEGEGNFSADPLLLPASQQPPMLDPLSPCLNRADPNSVVEDDYFERAVRTPTEDRNDVGADELAR